MPSRKKLKNRMNINSPYSICIRKVNKNHEDELYAVNQLWKEVYCNEQGRLRDINSKKFLLYDQFHDASDYYLATITIDKEEKNIGTVRVVRDSNQGLPIEQFFPLAGVKERASYFEPHRLMVLPEWRKKRFTSAPFGLAGLLFKTVISDFLVGKKDHSLIIDSFISTKESPISAFKKMGAKRFGIPFVDTELNSDMESVALICTWTDVLFKAEITKPNSFSNYLINNH